MREHSERQRRIQHRESWELLPWLVNASLSDAQVQRLEQHLGQCAECQQEYEQQLRIRQQMQSEESVLHTPHAALRKLMARIEHDEATAAARSDKPAAPRAASPLRWLTYAAAVEAFGVLALAGVLLWQSDYERSAPRYATLSSAPAVTPQGSAARVVFAPSLSLAELDDLLRSVNAQVVAGPSDAGVYTLVFPVARDRKDVAAIVARLRSNPQVRFAELSVADFGAAL